MRLPFIFGATAIASLCASCSAKSDAIVPKGYPASYAKQIDAARQEGELDILSATPERKAAGVMAAFRRLYPSIKVNFVEMSGQQVYDTVRRQSASGRGSADLVWSAAMDLQMKLVNDGLTQRYVSPERRPHFPRWSNWKNQAWAITAAPVVFIYNRRMISNTQVPKDHAQLRSFLENNRTPTKFKVATYAAERSAVGYLYFSQDQQVSHEFWRLVRDFGGNGAVFYPNAEDIVAAVSEGRASIGYDIIGSYALDAVKMNPSLGMVLPRDYALVLSRIVVIPAAARHPNSAKLFLDLMLSAKGQSLFAKEDMPPVRDDVGFPEGLDWRNAPLRAIRVGPGLLVTQDRLTRVHFLRRWHSQIEAGATAGRQAIITRSHDSTMTGAGR